MQEALPRTMSDYQRLAAKLWEGAVIEEVGRLHRVSRGEEEILPAQPLTKLVAELEAHERGRVNEML